MYFRERDVITGGFPQKLGIPLEKRDFGRFRLVMCIPITELNDTIPVLFKTSIKASPHPLSPPPSPPPSPHPPSPTLLAPTPLPFSATPSPQQFAPPPPKVNRQLKIVNYFTCMCHLFCRW